jgi:uncharacterized phiE125 gp8 family phage protein
MIPAHDLMQWLKAEPVDERIVASLEAAAVQYVSEAGGRWFGTPRTVTDTGTWHGGPFLLSSEPRGAVVLERWSGGVWSAIDEGGYRLDGRLLYPMAMRRGPLETWRVTYEAGYDEMEAPEDVQQAVRMLVGHWYENRESVVVGTSSTEIPHGVTEILRRYR